MALSAGTRLGPYEILEPLGAGGMGEVYRARDTRLGRDVAVKVLPEHVAQNTEALARFEREAHTAAGLNDPHICSLHDVGIEDDVHYAVFELLEGETLRERLSHGALLVSKAVELATQMCQGLATAHAKGIVHRDLKPENLFLTRSGLKILDLGLAKLLPGGGTGEEALSRQPTLSAQQQLTSPGTAPGTVAYMSPEQARGEQADARSDIFTTGAVLFEMLSGERPFRRGTQAETLVAILNEEPPELATPSGPAAPGLERIVRRCLEKDPEDRFQSARDVTFALEAVSGTSGVLDSRAEARQGVQRAPRWTLLTLGAVAVATLLAGDLAIRLWISPGDSGREGPVIRSHIDLTAERPLRSPRDDHPLRTELALSPDGTLLVWTSRPDAGGSSSALFLQRLDTGEVTRLSEAEEAHQPFFSPDGRWIGYCVWESNTKVWLRKVPAEGGLATDLAKLPWWPEGATWGTDGRILLGSPTMGIHWVPAEGGPAREITTADPTRETGHRLPSILPGGHALLMTTLPHVYGVRARVEAVSLPSGERTVVLDDAADARYLPTGHLIFARQGTLMTVPFDPERLELTAGPVPAVERVSQALGGAGDVLSTSGAAQFSFSKSGLLVYAPGGIRPAPPVELLLLDEKGRAEPLPGFDKPLVSPQMRYSPDGRQLVFVEQTGSGLLWLFDIERHTYRPLSDRGVAASPRWSPDGTRLVVAWSESGPFKLWMVPASGRGEWTRLTDGEHHDWAPSWSTDGRFLAFVRGDSPLMDIYLYRFEDGQVVPFLTSPALESHPEFSPDGRWLAYRSNETGRIEVHVTSFPDREQTFTVSREGGYAPAWSRDGRRLFYHSLRSPDGTRRMMSVTVHHDPGFSLGRPTLLFQLPDRFVYLWPMRGYELHPDGRRFLVGRLIETDPTPPITRLNLVHNWFAELEGLVATDR